MDSWNSEAADPLTYCVVRNHEEQYSLWRSDQDLPLGWTPEGFEGGKHACLAHIEKVWTDMRPLSVRAQIAEMANDAVHAPDALEEHAFSGVERLCALAEQPIVVSRSPTTAAFKEAVARGVVHVTFVTFGTELGIRLVQQAECEDARVGLRGEVVLDAVPLRFSGSVALDTLQGTGRLARV